MSESFAGEQAPPAVGGADLPLEQRDHVAAWLLWLLAAGLPALTTRHPAYILLLLLATVVVRASLPQHSPTLQGWRFFLRAGLLLWAITVPLNALTVHYGETVLAVIPRTLPLLGRLIGGPITLEAVVYGFLSGLGLLTILLVLVTFNQAVEPYHLLRAVPPVFFQTGVAVSIALTFVPQAANALREIRQAQAIRGHRWRGLRSLLPLLLPLLTTALERAVHLAESMEARGFGLAPLRDPALRRWGRRLLLPALLLLLAGLLLRPQSSLWGGALLGLGAAGLVAALSLQSRSVNRVLYRRPRWNRRSRLMALFSGLSGLAFLALLLARPAWLDFYPYPRLHWPGFAPLLGLPCLALTAPAWLPGEEA